MLVAGRGAEEVATLDSHKFMGIARVWKQAMLGEGEVQRVLYIALACVHTVPNKRSTMGQVLRMLQGKIEIPELVVDKTNMIC